jgi:hypothetical protein
MTTQEVLDSLDRERARLLRDIGALGDGATSLPITEDGWTAKDVLAHLIHWATQVAFGLAVDGVGPLPYMLEERRRREAAGAANPPMPTGDESNALAVAWYQDKPLDEVRAQFMMLADGIAERAATKSDDEMAAYGTIPWAGARSLWQFIAGDTFQHWAEHAAAIEQASARDA